MKLQLKIQFKFSNFAEADLAFDVSNYLRGNLVFSHLEKIHLCCLIECAVECDEISAWSLDLGHDMARHLLSVHLYSNINNSVWPSLQVGMGMAMAIAIYHCREFLNNHPTILPPQAQLSYFGPKATFQKETGCCSCLPCNHCSNYTWVVEEILVISELDPIKRVYSYDRYFLSLII